MTVKELAEQTTELFKGVADCHQYGYRRFY